MRPTLYKEIGELLKLLRENKLRVTQEEFARRSGISRPSLANIENGRQQISVGQLLTFATVLGVPPLELVPGIDSTENDTLVDALPVDIDPKLRAWVETVQGS